MQCPSLADLPLVHGKTGWPWDTESSRLPSFQPGGTAWPLISIVTPSFNQGQFLEETIRSVLLQGYPNLQYIIIDGGSSDNSVEIIQKYEAWISGWVSEKDQGQSDAINKGFERSTGTYGNWINSDDLLCMNALYETAKQVQFDGNMVYIGRCHIVDKEGKLLRKQQSGIHTLGQLIDIAGFWRNGGSIAQQAVLYPVSKFRQAGALNINNHLTMDYELWGGLLLQNCRFQYIPVDTGVFRTYQGQKISDLSNTTRSLLETARKLLQRSAFPFHAKLLYSCILDFYRLAYGYHSLRSKIGIRRRLQNLKNGSPA